MTTFAAVLSSHKIQWLPILDSVTPGLQKPWSYIRVYHHHHDTCYGLAQQFRTTAIITGSLRSPPLTTIHLVGSHINAGPQFVI